MEQIQFIFDYLEGKSKLYGLTLLTLSAGIEYIFPPFPGDTITIAGAVLIPKAGWPIEGVFGAIMLGSTVGAMFNWGIGLWLGDLEHRNTFIHRWLREPSKKQKLETLREKFKKYGGLYITLNRFVPAFRSLFFVAAGMSRIKWWKVVFFSALSASLWNSLLLAVGYMVGQNLEELVAFVEQYTFGAWIVIGVIVLGWIIWNATQSKNRKP